MVLERNWLQISLYQDKGDIERAIGTLIDVIKDNYNRPNEFQCIFDMYEKLIRLLIHQNSITSTSLSQFLSSPSTPFETPSLECIYHSFSSFSNYELENKSTELHNLRKASILGCLYTLHKLSFKFSTESEIIAIASDYCLWYLSISAMVYDL